MEDGHENCHQRFRLLFLPFLRIKTAPPTTTPANATIQNDVLLPEPVPDAWGVWLAGGTGLDVKVGVAVGGIGGVAVDDAVGDDVGDTVAVGVCVLVGVGVKVAKEMTLIQDGSPSAWQSSVQRSTIRRGKAQSPLSWTVTCVSQAGEDGRSW